MSRPTPTGYPTGVAIPSQTRVPTPPRRRTLDDSPERTIDGLTVRIDRLLCVGFGDCIEEAPEAFEFDGEGIAGFRGGAEATERERLLEACRACPVDALTVLDADGEQIVP